MFPYYSSVQQSYSALILAMLLLGAVFKVMERNLIHLYKDGNQWCAIYPMGSNLMECQAVAFSPVNIQFNENIGRNRDYGKYAALQKLKTENPSLPTHSFYTDHWD